MVKILAFAGSNREESFNRKLVAIAASGGKNAGAEVTTINLADFPMPIFNQDLEEREGIPEEARRFKSLMIEHDGFLIASPEYNGFFSPLLKNVLDWASRTESAQESPLLAFRNKKAAILAASPGSLGGIRGLISLRTLLSNLGVILLAEQVVIPYAFNEFSPSGELIQEDRNQEVLNLGGKLADFCEFGRV